MFKACGVIQLAESSPLIFSQLPPDCVLTFAAPVIPSGAAPRDRVAIEAEPPRVNVGLKLTGEGTIEPFATISNVAVAEADVPSGWLALVTLTV
jgi:hypothetical protein